MDRKITGQYVVRALPETEMGKAGIYNGELSEYSVVH